MCLTLVLVTTLTVTLSEVNAGSELLNPELDRQISAIRVKTYVVIDGELDEPAWQHAKPVSDFTQQEPFIGEPVSERTEVRLLYNDHNLYVGVYCFDLAGKEGLVVNDVRRDFPPSENDVFSILLDTFDDNRNGFVFSTNPKGAKRDGQVGGDGTTTNFDWDASWEVNSKITAQGWQAEIAIPFKSLRFRKDDDQVWGVNFLRQIRRKNERAHWSPIPVPFHLNRVSMAGSLDGMSGVRQGRNLYLKPYLSAPLVRRQGDDVDFVPDVGMDVKYGVASGMTLDLTVNTDFAQVEADERQINLTRFSLFFPEKREFFLENAPIFHFGKNARGWSLTEGREVIPFFSRRIGISNGQQVPILGGARLSGRVGKYRLGVLTMQSDEFKGTAATNFSVARVRRDILRNSDIGAIFINKEVGGGHFNRTYGIDANVKLLTYLDISSFLLKTDTLGASGGEIAADISLGWRDRFWETEAQYLTIEDNFNPEVGFVPRRGIKKSRGRFSIHPRPGETMPWIREFRPSVEVDHITNQDNLLVTRNLEMGWAIEFQNSTTIWIGREAHFERLDKPFPIQLNREIPIGDYNFSEYRVYFGSDRSRMFSTELRVGRGDFWNGERNAYEMRFLFQPGYYFAADISWNHDDITLPSGEFDTDFVTTRLRYSFNTRMFLNALMQYNSALREISSNVRLNFIYKPLSNFFLVYNERRSTTGNVLERALIAKLTYLFTF